MVDHIANRKKIIEDLRRELFGPDPAGPEIDVEGKIELEGWDAANGPWCQLGTREEILTRDNPNKRYGVGVLFPPEAEVDEIATGIPELEDTDDTGQAKETVEPETDDDKPASAAEAESDDLDLATANAYHPSSLGVSFLAELPEGSRLVVEATGGRYLPKAVIVKTAAGHKEVEGGSGKSGDEARNGGIERKWWLRRQVELRVEFDAQLLVQPQARRFAAPLAGGPELGITVEGANTEGLDLRFEVFSRPRQDGDRRRLLTVCLVNRSKTPGRRSGSEVCLFQSRFKATVVSPAGTACVLPYPEPQVAVDPEDRSLRLLYRNAQVFATGHGCAADWRTEGHHATHVVAECLPAVEVPNITPEIKREDGSRISIPMAPLAGLVEGNDGRASLAEVVDRYELWIAEQRKRIGELDELYEGAATTNLDECATAIQRMREGLAYLSRDPMALHAFQLANHAILLQQAMWRIEPRHATLSEQTPLASFAEGIRRPSAVNMPPGRGEWRPFQIGFLLASILSAARGDAPDRRLVDLIWFPTGGGKTEAYLGLAAFAMFKRRLEDPSDAGVHVLMRYTLRLLTTQQFQRASTLICAMEYLRRQNEADVGDRPFSAGIWLGGETTPNTRKKALDELRELENWPQRRNPFLLTRCPWCGAQFGRVEPASEKPATGGAKTSKGNRKAAKAGGSKGIVLGYTRAAGTVVFKCPDQDCDFSTGLPIWVVDEDIYDIRPTLVIGTIDKFAMLAWRPEAHTLFGLDLDGKQILSPPGLIIQDELHLIAGPLGSMAGLFETVIEELCTDRCGKNPVPPKIVCSTATIRRYAHQVKGLYARDRVRLFPPPELEAEKSFFSRYDTDNAGRIFAGVHATSLGSVQTEWVRVFTTLLQAPAPFTDVERDPWWTMMVFFNSIREMGTAHTLFQSDVPDYQKVVWTRRGTQREQKRWLNASGIFELTGGMESGEIAGAIATLEVGTTSTKETPRDVCLASSIIEVGIDIPRLSLMVVAGQPKTTSQYIQVTGRVGRSPDKPALIVTLYSPSKPRDRSHYERFRSYHERLYASVEPTSVTPLATPVLKRALHAVLVSFARQTGGPDVANSPKPFPKAIVDRFQRLLSGRVDLIDSDEKDSVMKVFACRAEQWEKWKRTRWTRSDPSDDTPLLRPAGEHASDKDRRFSWATQMSMRNVDAECVAGITSLYNLEQVGEDE